MKKQKHIAVDLDDVVLSFWAGVCNAISVEYGIDIDPTETRDWDYNPIKQLDVFGNGRDWWDWLRERDWLWATFGVIPGAIGGLAQLRQAGFYLECISVCPEWGEWPKWKWMGLWRPPFNQVTLITPGQKKVDMTDAYLLIDDKPSNCNEFASAGREAILFQQPWNRNAVMHKRTRLGTGWPAITKELLQK